MLRQRQIILAVLLCLFPILAWGATIETVLIPSGNKPINTLHEFGPITIPDSVEHLSFITDRSNAFIKPNLRVRVIISIYDGDGLLIDRRIRTYVGGQPVIQGKPSLVPFRLEMDIPMALNRTMDGSMEVLFDNVVSSLTMFYDVP